MKINLKIDHLVLEGISIEPRQRDKLRETVEAELSRCLSRQGMSHGKRSSVSRNTVQGGSIHIRESTDISDIGLRIAEAVYKGIKG